MPDAHYGFVRIATQSITELKATATLWRHTKTGAQLLSLQNADVNKSFAITFPTLPTDNSGVAHILEHSVLNGSRKFPVKEPFVELLKCSVCSFLNAFTYPDKTVYPLASQNEEDFYNLIDVYLDAVFFPNLSEQTFQQEGWHYEPGTKSGEWVYKGVVFNEMKGSDLSADRHVWQQTQSALFPDTPYRWDSGGVPEEIVNLTHDQFVQFHKRHYHPAQSLIWMAGNDSEDRRLRTLAAYLDEFGPLPDANVHIPVQQWNRDVAQVRASYPATTPDPKQAFATKTWVLTAELDVATQVELSLIEYLLIGTSTAPLRKALIDSGLGEDIAGGGVEFDLRQNTFSVGLRGVLEQDAPAVFTLIQQTIESIVRTGFESDTLEAALTTTEFNLRENNTGNFPQGLNLGLRVLRGWLYGAKPIEQLPFEQPMQSVRQKLYSQPDYLQRTIAHYFLENSHAVELTLIPDAEIVTKRMQAEQKRLHSFAATLSKKGARELAASAAQLQAAQQTPDSEQVLQTLPRLHLSDIERQSKRVPTELVDHSSVRGYVHELQTNGIVYFDLSWPIDHILSAQLPLLAVFANALTELGTTQYPEEVLQTVIDSCMGGLSTQVFVGHAVGSDRPVERLVLRVKALPEKMEAVLAVLESIVTDTSWGNKRRFAQLVAEEQVQFEASLTDDGHRLVGSRLASHLTPAGAVAEQLTGVSQLQYIRALKHRVAQDWKAVETELQNLAAEIFFQPAEWNLTVDQSSRAAVEKQLMDFAQKRMHMPAPTQKKQQTRASVAKPQVEALTIASPVNFVGMGFRVSTTHGMLPGSALVATQLLRTDYLWNSVRVQGGAYGAAVRIEPISGVVVATSYRDPHLKQSLQIFADMSKYLQSLAISESELEKAKIGTLGELDHYRLPDAEGFLGFVHQLTGLTPEIRQKLRDEVFATTLNDLRQLGSLLAEQTHDFSVAITAADRAHGLGSRVKITPITTETQ